MRKLFFICFGFAALLFAAACSHLDEPKEYINVYLNLPEQDLTKAETPAETKTKENAIRDLKIWVFLSESAGKYAAGTPVGYLAPSSSDLNKSVHAIPIIDKGLALVASKVDVYILANSKATGLDDGGKCKTGGSTKDWGALSVSDLNGLMLEGSAFGVTSGNQPTNERVVDTQGLPYSAYGKGMLLTDDYPDALSVAALTLVRTVSKVRVVVSQIQEESGNKPMNFKITGLKINENMIASQEYLFNTTSPTTSYSISDAGYVANPLAFVSSDIDKSSINGCLTPSKYTFGFVSGETTIDYQNRIDAGLSANELSEMGCGFCYLRETDKRIEGTISYQIGTNPEQSQVFKIDAAGDFARNRSWIVYIYFFDDTMRFSVTGTDWTSGGKTNLTP